MTETKHDSEPKPSTRPFAVDDVPWEEWTHGARFGGRVRALSAFGGGSHLGVNLEELPPGKQSCPLHYHLLEEEHLLILDGHATLRMGEERHELGPGSYVCFPAGQKAGHALVNGGTETCRFLIVGERNPNDVIIYPDSGKVLVRPARAIFRQSATMEYWDGET